MSLKQFCKIISSYMNKWKNNLNLSMRFVSFSLAETPSNHTVFALAPSAIFRFGGMENLVLVLYWFWISDKIKVY